MLQSAFNTLAGKTLKLGARLDSPALCRLGLGRTHVFNNSAALRIAGEHKNYDAVEAILTRLTEEDGGFMTCLDLDLGEDLTAFLNMTTEDEKLATLYDEHEQRAAAQLDKLIADVDAALGAPQTTQARTATPAP